MRMGRPEHRIAKFGDPFSIGKVDAIVSLIDGPPALPKNLNPEHHHWVELKLVGGAKCPRNAAEKPPNHSAKTAKPGAARLTRPWLWNGSAGLIL